MVHLRPGRETGTPRDARGRLDALPARVHDLLHTFAVTTMIDWYRDGQDVQVRLPLLSTWLGHVDPASTYWYLHAVPELLAHAANRLDAQAGSPTTEPAS